MLLAAFVRATKVHSSCGQIKRTVHLFTKFRAMATGSDPPVAKHQNRLAKEKSPYLLQHASNPVDW